MKGDITRVSYDRARHYSSVRMQQGRVQLDADWNEQLDILAHLDRTTTVDVVGPWGAPKQGGGFAIGLAPGGADLTISPGRIYVRGILVEWEPPAAPVLAVTGDVLALPHLDAGGAAFAPDQWLEILHDGSPVQAQITAVDTTNRTLTVNPAPPALTGAVSVRRLATYSSQPFYPNPPALPQGPCVVHLDVWERHVTALEDPQIREIALGGPDTTTRTQVVWQVKLLALPDWVGPLTCDNAPDWAALLPAGGGQLTARTHPEEEQTDPCLTPPGAGYRLLENQLYRVEIHRVNADGSATFKWSRDNGSVVTAWTGKVGDNLQVRSLGRDAVLGFYGQTYAELTDDAHELRGEPGTLVRVTPSAAEDNTLTIDATAPAAGSTDFADFPLNPKVRRWDSPGEVNVTQPATNDGYIALEGGVEVRFEMDAPYRPGDYWLIPARTAVGEQGGDILWPRDSADPNNPLPQAARGVQHDCCLLAVWTPGADPQDCRPDFPPLTGICAEDVCFNNTNCDLPDVKTVQDVLDYLCQGSDLRFHNKHLHGWGIVCGLQVACDSPATVRVRPGYALDCEGRDLRVQDDVTLDIAGLAVASGLEQPPLEGTAHYHLRLDAAMGGYAFALELPPDKARNPWPEILQGTLLLDFWSGCAQPLLAALQAALEGDGAAGLVKGREQRVISLVNLFVQLLQPAYGSRVYLSRKEHDLLVRFYKELVAVLESDTFCMLLNTLAPLPDYPFDDAPQDTIFGRGYHRRLRLNPDGTTGYTVGYNNQIQVYDLVARQLVNTLAFPASGALVVQDVAVSRDSAQLYAIATSGADTYIVAGAIDGSTVTWGNLSTFPGIQLVALDIYTVQNGRAIRFAAANQDVIVAAGKGTGIYAIVPDLRSGQFVQQLVFECNATGHLQCQGLHLVATASQAGSADAYDSLVWYDAFRGTFDVRTFAQFTDATGAGAGMVGQDGFVLAYDPEVNTANLAVSIDSYKGADTRHALLLQFDGASPFVRDIVDLREATPVHFAYNPAAQSLVIAYADSFRLGLLDLAEGVLDPESVYPVQISPAALAFGAKTREVFVLNTVSNTLTVVNAEILKPGSRFDMETLQAYRTGMLQAYLSLVAAVAQHIKDCFCDLLLVNCPDCDEDDKVYLAEVTLRNGEVYKVCNFARRKQVKTFPKVSYWMSLIPVEAVLDYAVEQLCCLVFPDLLAGLEQRSKLNIRGGTMAEGAAYLQRNPLRSLWGNLVRSVRPARKMASQWLGQLGAGATRPGSVRSPGLRGGAAYIEQPAQLAQAQLAAAEVEVIVQPYDSARGLQNIANYLGSLGQIAPGSQVTLFTEGDVVKSIAVQPPRVLPAPPIRPLRAVPLPPASATASAPASAPASTGAQETDALRGEIAGLRAELERLHEAGAEAARALGERDARIDELFATVAALRQEITRPARSRGKSRPAPDA